MLKICFISTFLVLSYNQPKIQTITITIIITFYIVLFVLAKPRKNWLYFLIQLLVELNLLSIFACTIYLAFSK